MSDLSPKIFGIGFHKTGTTSLGAALSELGYRVCGSIGVNDPRIGESALDLARATVPLYDAFQDNPWPILFHTLDREYPGSRFILTLRDPERWIASQLKHFGTEDTPMRKWIYGAGHPSGNEARYLERYAAHNREVLAYFRDRPEDLLVMNLEEGDGFEKLCPFLGLDPLGTEFPHRNPSERREQRREESRRRDENHARWERIRNAAARLLGRP